jgi:hypothetical protein
MPLVARVQEPLTYSVLVPYETVPAIYVNNPVANAIDVSSVIVPAVFIVILFCKIAVDVPLNNPVPFITKRLVPAPVRPPIVIPPATLKVFELHITPTPIYKDPVIETLSPRTMVGVVPLKVKSPGKVSVPDVKVPLL